MQFFSTGIFSAMSETTVFPLNETTSLKQQWDDVFNAGDLKELSVLLTYKVVYIEPSLSTALEVRFSASKSILPHYYRIKCHKNFKSN
jgi:hypothetical protein